MQRTTSPTRGRLLAAAISLTAAPALALVAACAGGSSGGTTSTTAGAAAPASSSTSAQAATYPVTVTGDNGQVTIPAQPKKIVSLAPADTEILYAIGAGPQVVAVDDQSNYPQGVPTTKLSGYKPNAEAIAGYAPDLVVLSGDDNGVVAALTKLKIPALVSARRRRSTRATPSTRRWARPPGTRPRRPRPSSRSRTGSPPPSRPCRRPPSR